MYMADHRGSKPGRGPEDPAWGDNDPLFRALRTLPSLSPPAATDARVRARATTQFLRSVARHDRLQHRAAQRAAGKLARLARPILPLSIASAALAYLIWAVHTASTFIIR
jgi:hypothetical protein